MQLKILSWNIWIDGNFGQIADFLKEANADIIGLQEVKDDDPARNVIGYLKGAGYQHVSAPVRKTWGGKVWNDGCAIFSKFPILTSTIHPLSKENTRIALQADIRVNNDTLHVFSTHLVHTHQKQSDVQDEQVEKLISLLPKERVMVMGDFNATPESTVVRRMREVLKDTDPSSAPTWSVHPKGCHTCNPQKIDTRLDYIFASKDLKIHSPAVGSSKASDHLPISVILEI